MPSHASPTLRPRQFHRIVNREGKAQHGHAFEHIVHAMGIAINAGFLAASWMFYSTMSETCVIIADWIFIIGSLGGVALALHHVHESHGLDHISEMTQLTGLKSRKRRDEFLEHIMFAVASFVFFLGSIFFMPGLYGENKDAEYTGQRYGARLFIAGSFMLVICSFFAAIGMASDPEHHLHLKPGSIKMRCHYMFLAGLMLSQIASVCFVTGSVLFRPCFASAGPLAGDIGCDFYVAGSVLYLLESLLSFGVLRIKDSAEFANADAEGGAEHVGEKEG